MGLRWDIIVCSDIGDALRFILQLLCLFGICFPASAFSQNLQADSQNTNLSLSQAYQERGLPYIASYTPDDYKAHIQNWDFMQANNGLIYVGNTSGILEYDGVSWRLIPLPNGSPVKSLAKSTDGTIYVGGVRDLGYLQPDSLGQMQFQTLLPKLDSTYQDFADIWFTYAIDDAIYFISDDYIFRWHNNRFKVWESQTVYGWANMVHDQIYINGERGIMRLEGDSLALIPDGDKFVGKSGEITVMLPYSDNKILMAHLSEGLFLYDHHKIVPFKEGRLLDGKFIYSGAMLHNGDYVFVTLGSGCFIMDREGNIKQWLGKRRGLNSNTIFGAYVDEDGNLWLAGENGINRVEISSALRIFDQQSGLTEGVDRVGFYSNRFYAGGKNGVFYLHETSSEPDEKDFTFQKIEGIDQQTWDLKAKGGYLLAGNFNGLYQINQDHQVKLLIPENTSRIISSAIDPNRLFAGTMHGQVYSLLLVNNLWQVEKSPLTFEGRVLEMAENPDGSLWLSTRYNGVYKVDFPSTNANRSFDKPFTLTHYDTLDGLPEMSYNAVFRVQSGIYFSTQKGIFRFDSTRQQFTPDSLLMSQLGTSEIGFENTIEPAEDGGMWLTVKSNFENKVYKANKGVLTEVTALNRLPGFTVYDVLDPGEAVFFVGPKGIVGYTRQSNQNYKPYFPAKIRSVFIDSDSLLFAGHSSEENVPNPASISFGDNSLRFVYALPSYNKSEANEYQYFLEGFDEEWSAWTTETQRDFTNLPEGDYRFRVRGKNVYGQVSGQAAFAFTILPPWYRTWWAYGLYALAFIGFVISIVKWRSRKLQREKEALQKTVAEQTQQVKQQAEQLKELDEAKSRFFANISHEFRTPLTLILGQVQQLESDGLSDDPQPVYQMIKRNGQRVLGLVNQLLDLSTLEAGTVKLEAVETDLITFLKPIIAAYESLAESKQITFNFEHDEDDIPIYLDPDKVEQVMHNLLSNAFKFTDENGTVSLKVWVKEIADTSYAQINVEDNGPGIAPEQQEHIFDRFYQVDNTATKQKEGTGIGLALAKELTELHQGEINVAGAPGKGASFTVLLPLGKAHLSSDEITEPPEQEKEITVREEVLLQSEQPGDSAEKTTTAANADTPQILVVEDNADMRRYIHQILHPHYQIAEAEDGSAGWEKAIEMIPDLIISDVMMPEMDGIELSGKLKNDERTSHIPVILLTAKAGKTSKLEGLETRADDYLTKPFDADELLILLRNRIEQRKKLRERFSKEVTLQPKDIAITSADERFLQKATDIVEDNMDDFDFNVEGFVEQMHLGHTQVNRKLKALTDLTPVQFIRFMRLKRAAQKIEQEEDTISQIAYSVGFNNLSYFAKCFKEQFGQLPSEYGE